MKIVSIVSARPNFIKLAAVHHAFQQHAPQEWEHIIVHTGQHFDPLLSEVFFRELGIPVPQVNLNVSRRINSAANDDNEDTVVRTMHAALPVLENFQPDLVLVYGDVSGALGGARAAHEFKVPVAHIEAGLRSFDDTMPEEYNRREIDKISDLLFVTEKSGLANLKDEGITKGMHFVGNTMIDTLVRMQPKTERQALSFSLPKRFGVVTLHRPSNVDCREHLKSVMKFLNEIAKYCELVFPMHPRTRGVLLQEDQGLLSSPPTPVSQRLHIIDPLGYLAFLHVLSSATFVLTDSGGIQEEATFLGKKCFTLRKNTERPCTLEKNGGSNTLIDLVQSMDREQVLAYARHPTPVQVHLPEKWDGRAGERIIDVLQQFVRKHDSRRPSQTTSSG